MVSHASAPGYADPTTVATYAVSTLQKKQRLPYMEALMKKGFLVFVSAVSLIAACTTSTMPTAPASSQSGLSLAHAGHDATAAAAGDVHSAAHADKGYIDGWFNGEKVQLYYTKSFFCAEPPDSGATTSCELGAAAETAPRPGPIPVIYAIAAAGGIQPPLSTLSCAPGTVCLNHPGMIDASRVGGSATGSAVPHSHILSERGGGWFRTVNIRVRSLSMWNEIAAAKSLDKVRELQVNPPIGADGLPLISADTPTNIFFFIASWRPVQD